MQLNDNCKTIIREDKILSAQLYAYSEENYNTGRYMGFLEDDKNQTYTALGIRIEYLDHTIKEVFYITNLAERKAFKDMDRLRNIIISYIGS